jgi:hypothetical protein
MQSAVLKAIVEQVHLRAELRLGKFSGSVAIFSNHHRNLHSSRNQKRLIAKLARQACGIYKAYPAALASVAARENIEADAARLQQLAQQNDEWSFS